MFRPVLSVALIALLLAAPAHAQDALSPGSLASEFEQRLTAMERQQAQLNGQIEQLQNMYATLRQEQKQYQESVDYRLKALEGGAGVMPPARPMGAPAQQPGQPMPMPLTPMTSRPNPNGGMPIAEDGQMGFGQIAPQAPAQGIVQAPTAPTPTTNAPPPQVLADPQQLYNYAYNQMSSGDYTGAAAAFKSFMATYPQHALAGNAQYWLGETYFVNADYKTAALTFGEGFQKYPKGAKAPDNLLKLGISLARLGKTADACVAFAQLYAKFPDAPPAITTRAQTEMNKLGSCE